MDYVCQAIWTTILTHRCVTGDTTRYHSVTEYTLCCVTIHSNVCQVLLTKVSIIPIVAWQRIQVYIISERARCIFYEHRIVRLVAKLKSQLLFIKIWQNTVQDQKCRNIDFWQHFVKSAISSLKLHLEFVKNVQKSQSWGTPHGDNIWLKTVQIGPKTVLNVSKSHPANPGWYPSGRSNLDG